MTVSPSRPGGTFRIGGELEVARLGFGAMRITGPGIWGQPADREAALATLRLLPELGVNFVDTADAYGPFVSEELIHEALSPYKGMVIATKGGHTRHGPDTTPERQFEAIAAMHARGLVRHVGLSEVTVEMIERARLYFPVATVQNRFNLVNRYSEEVLDYCTRENIGFIPWAPLAAGGLARGDNVLTRVAQARGATTGQVALAWLLRRSPVMLPIPGTSSPDHARANAQAATLSLTDAEFDALDRDGRAEWDRLRA